MCQEVTELDLADWKARIEGKGAEVLPEVKQFNFDIRHDNMSGILFFRMRRERSKTSDIHMCNVSLSIKHI